jgi:hypothetical protein
MCTGAEIAAIGSTVAPSVIGEKQLGGVAPSPGGIGGGMGLLDLLPGDAGALSQLAQASNFGQQPLDDAITTPASEQGKSMSDIAAEGNFGEGIQEQENPFLKGLGGVFSNIDSTLQSPARMLGIGLLGKLNPALGIGGLIAGGAGLLG